MAASKFNSSEGLSDCMTFLNSSNPYADVQIHCLDIDIDDTIYWKERCKHFLGGQDADDIDSCLRNIKFDRLDRIFLIVSERFASKILAEVEQIAQVISVFIFCKDPTWKDINVTLYKKYCGTFENKDNLLAELNYDILQKTSMHSSRDVFRDEEIRQESFLDPNDPLSFSLLCVINNDARPLLETDYMSCDKQQMFRECRLLFRSDPITLKQIDELSKRYNPNESIIYYTGADFLYNVINKVIRTQSTEIIGKFRFFIKDFEEMLDLRFTKQIFNQWSSFSEPTKPLLIVYRGQLLPSADLAKLKSFIGKNMIISQYISTTKNIRVAEVYAGAGENSPESESILYHIDTSVIYKLYDDKPDPSIYYYDISDISKNPDEEEVLLRIGTTFKVLNIEKSSDKRWHVDLRVEKVNDYRSQNKINRTPKEIVQSFFQKASKQQKIDVEDIINKHLSSDILIKMSIYIRLGHLVKHHPREQLFYYQYALSQIPSNESKLLDIGYWAIRIRCIFSVNDWRLIPINIYRQTVIHIQGNLKKKLHNELARIEMARGDFDAAKFHYNKLHQFADGYSEQTISDELSQFINENEWLKPVLKSDDVPYRYLYTAILTTGERAIIDYHCKVFYQSIDTLSLTENFSFADILPNVDPNEHYQLLNEFSNNIKIDHTDLSIKHILIISLIDKPFILKVQENLTIGQLKEKIRSHLEISSFIHYDFRLIHLGKTLINDEKLSSEYQINDQAIIYLIYGPSSKNQPVTRLDKECQENTGLTSNVIQHICLVEKSRLEKFESRSQMHAFNPLYRSRNIDQNQSTNNTLNKFVENNLYFSQYDEDDNDADPADLLNLPNSIAHQYFENSGPQTSASQLSDLMGRHPYQLNIPINNNNQQTSSNDLDVNEEQINNILSKCIAS